MKLNEQHLTQDTSYRLITLTQGQVAVVDAQDYERCCDFTWHLYRVKKGLRIVEYAATHVRNGRTKTTLRLHRFIMRVDDPAVEVDHRDHDGLNCRRSNLRIATRAQNLHNARIHANSFSGYKGVGWHKTARLWFARISVNKKIISLGYFKDAASAARAYDVAAREHFGEFAHINFP